ncbi:hypothetical protein [Edwardsiella sp. EA181011]|uniref:hypothetical protein n=1 Tax=Edwardsiella sp. EA181011 TaxID=1578828 RepID=UPI00118730FA
MGIIDSIKRWKWWLVVIITSPIIIAVVLLKLVSVLLERAADAFVFASDLFGAIPNAPAPKWFDYVSKFAHGEKRK